MPTIKESSDEFNPTVITPATAVPLAVPRKWTARDYIAFGVATWGVGFLPGAPGTWGSAVGVLVYLLVREASAWLFAIAVAHGSSVPPLESFRMTFMLMMLIVLSIAGIRAATRTEQLLGVKDPGLVVVDEVVGQLITFIFVPFSAGLWMVFVGFVVFRVFDIWKPYPVRRLERLESGLGIMADDVLAGAYAATLMSLLSSVYLLL